MNLADLDKEIEKATGDKPGKRVSYNDLLETIDKIEFHHPKLSPTLTICFIRLKNGFVVTGESACADPGKFDRQVGRSLARDRAMAKIWDLEGYMLREKLYRETLQP